MKTKVKWTWIFVGVSITLIGTTRLLCAEVEWCGLKKMAKAEPGYECQVETQNGNVIWQLQVKTASGKKVLKDMKSDLLVSDILDGEFTQDQAKKICTNFASLEARGNLTTSVNWRLPTGYPKSLNGQFGFSSQDSDFETLEANGVREVIDMDRRSMWSRWGMSKGWSLFWSSSGFPYFSDFAYGFNGDNGDIGYGYGRSLSGSVLCVGR